ncbi:MAG: J domain-containing protein [Chitinophagaceae bacterium]
MEFIDYYKVLELEKNATPDDIKKAYRKLARKHHPDLNPDDKGAHVKFQQINEANEVLSDPEKREKYNQHGGDWKHAEEFEKARESRQQSAHANRDQSDYGEYNDGNFSDFFSSMFGGTENKSSKTKFRGQDYNTELRLSLADAYMTHQQTIAVNGKKIRITIPAGIENGQVIKLKGHGGRGINSGPNGDLYITFSIADDPKFKRYGNDLHTTVYLDLYAAVLGGEITIDTWSGRLKLTVKSETQNGTKIRLKGKGFPVYKEEGQFGDLYVTYSIKIPTSLTERQIELFTELSKS